MCHAASFVESVVTFGRLNPEEQGSPILGLTSLRDEAAPRYGEKRTKLSSYSKPNH
jgi:hypothetical protein